MQALHEPAFILAVPAAATAPQPASPHHPSAAGATGADSPPQQQPERTLHCCYACCEATGRPVALVATDERGELLVSRLLAPDGAHKLTSGAEGVAAAVAASTVLTEALRVNKPRFFFVQISCRPRPCGWIRLAFAALCKFRVVTC